MTDGPAIAFEHVRFVVPPGKVLLDDLSLEVAAGETLVLLGRSGCGKTTTMRMINRMLEPTSGVVRVEGQATTTWDPIRLRRRIGYVLQEAGLFPHETVAENVALVPRLEGWEPARVEARVEELLALVGLPPGQFGGRWPRELSGGQRQRVGIARALAADPPVLLMDEPFSALDPITRRDLALEVRELQRRLGKTIVFVTHDIREAFAIATRVGLMDAGRLVYLGPPAGLAASSHPEARAFLACLDDPPPLAEGGVGVNFFGFLAANAGEVAQAAGEHVGLVAVAIGIASLVGVPTGVLLTRYPALARPVLAFANIAQTIPSLALFGFLIPLNLSLFGARILGGIGPGTAIAALALYALLPIVRNTYTGIEGVDPTVREAGRAMGMTSGQLLRRVELPLALPIIVAGVRVATVITVGTATVAAAIDAGGLGKFIFRGLRMADDAQILAGAVPAALIAIAADLLLGWLERALAPGGGRVALRRVAIGTALVGAIVAGELAYMRLGASPAPARIVVGAKDFTEQIVLGELVAQTLEAKAGVPVVRRFDLGGSLAHQALVAGEIDVYVEYTGTALMAILKAPPMTDPAAVRAKVTAAYAKQFDLLWTEPLGFDNTFAILVRGDDARRHRLRTISEAARLAPGWRAGFGPDFMVRADGYAAFARAYALDFKERPREMDLALTYRALRDGQVDLVAGNATDGMIARYGLVQLADDKRFFPPYDAIPILRGEVARRHPAVREALAALGGRVDVAEMRALNDAVDTKGEVPKAAVAAFLRREGLAP